MKFLSCFFIVLVGCFSAAAQKLILIGKPEIAFPNLVSTKDTEVKLTFSPDGRRMLWGTIGWENGAGGWDIWQSVKTDGKWSAAQPVSFNSPENDFDPFFAPDGKGVYFFSNRAGGFGSDDIYFAAFDEKSQSYAKPENLGAKINSKGDEWGAVVSADNKTLIFCTDGRGGAGKHDIFSARRKGKSWREAVALKGKINSPLDDFDPVFLSDGKTIVFASERSGKDMVDLYVSYLVKGAYSEPESLGAAVNSAEYWDFGCSVNYAEPNVLYFNSYYPENKIGKVDVYKISYRLQ